MCRWPKKNVQLIASSRGVYAVRQEHRVTTRRGNESSVFSEDEAAMLVRHQCLYLRDLKQCVIKECCTSCE